MQGSNSPIRGKARSSAFTLIELLVVIAIIAILAAILFPVFAQAREKARAISCLSNLKNLGNAMIMYTQDYDESYPCGWMGGNGGEAGTTMWRVALMPYIQKYGDPKDKGSAAGQWGVYSCPSQPANIDFGPTSYGYNTAHSGMTTGWIDGKPDYQEYIGKNLASLRRPASLVAFADAAQISGSQGSDPNDTGHRMGEAGCYNYETNGGSLATGACGPFTFNPLTWKADNPWGSVDWSMGVPGGNGDGDWTANGQRRPVGRHQGFTNAVFADGHAKAVRMETLKVKLGTPEDVWHDHE